MIRTAFFLHEVTITRVLKWDGGVPVAVEGVRKSDGRVKRYCLAGLRADGGYSEILWAAQRADIFEVSGAATCNIIDDPVQPSLAVDKADADRVTAWYRSLKARGLCR